MENDQHAQEHARALAAYAHILGVSPDIITGTVARIRALGAPVEYVHLDIDATIGGYGRSHDGVNVCSSPPRIVMRIGNTTVRRYDIADSATRLAWAVSDAVPVGAGVGAIVALLRAYADDLDARARARARVRYRSVYAAQDNARRDADVAEARAAAVGVRAIADQIAAEAP